MSSLAGKYQRIHCINAICPLENELSAAHIAWMDEPKIRLSPKGRDGTVWKWEVILMDRVVASGMAAGSQEYAYTVAHEALLNYRKTKLD